MLEMVDSFGLAEPMGSVWKQLINFQSCMLSNENPECWDNMDSFMLVDYEVPVSIAVIKLIDNSRMTLRYVV